MSLNYSPQIAASGLKKENFNVVEFLRVPKMLQTSE